MSSGFRFISRYALAAVMLLAPTLLVPGFALAQDATDATDAIEANPASPVDVVSIDALIAALYDTISGPAGPRDWDRLRSLFANGAQMISVNPGVPGGRNLMLVDGYVERAGGYFMENGFYEGEISRQTQRFGNIAHVFTTYESRRAADDPEPFTRGINSVQLLFHEDRWWIINIYWQGETGDHQIPDEYLP